jgi:hypothetical protein
MNNSYEIKQSRMTRAEIQRDLDLIRLAYRERDMETLNRRRGAGVICWTAIGMAIGAAAAIHMLIFS